MMFQLFIAKKKISFDQGTFNYLFYSSYEIMICCNINYYQLFNIFMNDLSFTLHVLF